MTAIQETAKQKLDRILADIRARKQAEKQREEQESKPIVATPIPVSIVQSPEQKERLAEIQARASKALEQLQKQKELQEAAIKPAGSYVPSPEKVAKQVEVQLEKATGNLTVPYNIKQKELIRWTSQWKTLPDWKTMKRLEVVLSGAAGTGKTTSVIGAAMELLNDPCFPKFEIDTKWLQWGTPGVAFVAYTNKAVAQVRRNVPEQLKNHCITIHKLIEFAPEYYEVEDPETGEIKTKMRFAPQRHAMNRLPRNLKVLFIDESSMVDTFLYDKLIDALHPETKIIYIGDINQLPPVFGDPILGTKLVEEPIIELTEIYRQAADNPIISFAWKILQGKYNFFSPRSEKDEKGTLFIPSYRRLTEESNGKIKVIPWASKISTSLAMMTINKKFKSWVDSGEYNPWEDIVLIPYNVQLGTIEFNKSMAQYLGDLRQAVVHEVISGIAKHYLAVGDKVLWMKEEYIITEIVRNGKYFGTDPKPASIHLTRDGQYRKEETSQGEDGDLGNLEDIDAMLEHLAYSADDGNNDEDKFNQASHIIKVECLYDRSVKYELSTAGQVNSLLFAYALTVHKSQGSEWRKVFVVLHRSHKTAHYRELLYTAVTRARDKLVLICEPDSIEKCIKNPRIKGNTLQEKLAFLKKKLGEKKVQSGKTEQEIDSES